jgi:hypothetical protein
MYQFTLEPTAWIDFEWDDADEEGFERKNAIRLKVVFLPLSEMEKIEARSDAEVKRMLGQDLSTEEEALLAQPPERTLDFAARVTRDWGQILGLDKRPFPFTAENLALMVEHATGFAGAFYGNYRRAWGGKGKVREKNSLAPAGGGPADEAAAGTKLPASASN